MTFNSWYHLRRHETIEAPQKGEDNEYNKHLKLLKKFSGAGNFHQKIGSKYWKLNSLRHDI